MILERLIAGGVALDSIPEATHCGGFDLSGASHQANEVCGQPDHLGGRHAACPQRAHARRTLRLTEFGARGSQDEGVMSENRGPCATEHACEPQLTTGGVEQVPAANHHVYPLQHVIHGDGKLIGPLPVAIAQEEVAALSGWLLRLRTEEEIVEGLDTRPDDDSPGGGRLRLDRGLPTRPRIRAATDVTTRASAPVDLFGSREALEDGFIDRRAFALTERGLPGVVWCEPEPREILEQRDFVHRSTPDPVVVLEAKEYSGSHGSGDPPDIDGVRDVSKMEVAGWGRGEAGDERLSHCPDATKIESGHVEP